VVRHAFPDARDAPRQGLACRPFSVELAATEIENQRPVL
jgi:hypothetical protein